MKRTGALLALVVGTGLALGDDGPAFRKDAARTGTTTETVPPNQTPPNPAMKLRWSTPLPGGEAIGSPIVGGGRVYVPSRDGIIHCLSADDGTEIWHYTTLGQIVATPAYWKGRLYVSSTDGYLYILHGLTGALIVPPILHGNAIQGSPVVADNVSIGGVPTAVLFLTLGSPALELRAYNAHTGALLWVGSGLRQVSFSSPAYSALFNRVIVGDNAGFWHCFDASNGTLLWDYQAGPDVFYTCAAIMDPYIALPSAGGSNGDIHVLHQQSLAPYYTVWKIVPAIPPASTVNKVGGSGPTQQRAVTYPEAMVDQETRAMLLQQSQAEYYAYLDNLSKQSGVDYSPLKAWLDIQTGVVNPNPSLIPGALPPLHMNYPVLSSAPTFGPPDASDPAGTSIGRVFVAQRELSGVNNDLYYTVSILVSNDATQAAVTWGTTPQAFVASDLNMVASPSTSNALWLYTTRCSQLEVRKHSDGTLVGFVDAGGQILGGPTLSNGRVYVTTGAQQILCYDTGNAPPTMPSTFTPSGGMNVTWTGTPTVSWTGAIDPDPGDTITYELQYGVGYANRDLELQETNPIAIASGSSYTITPSIPGNTHVYWRVRTLDNLGARSMWSDIQDFWINHNTTAPEPPGSVSALPLAESVEVDWTASPSSGILKYRIYYKKTSAAWSGATMIDNLSGFTYTVTGLLDGTSYDFMVVAVNTGENESAGVVASATPQAAISIGGTAYGSIQAAINAASPGQTVQLGVGTFNGNLVLRPGVSLVGYSPKYTHIVGSGTGIVITVQGVYGTDPMSTIAMLSITNGQKGIATANADLYVHNVVVYAINGNAIEHTAATTGRLQVVNTTLMVNLGDGVYALTAPANTVLRNNLAGKNGGIGVNVQAGSGVTYNAAWMNTGGDFAAGVGGTGDSSTPAVFTNETAYDYTEATGSPSIDAGDPSDPYSLEPNPNGGRVNQGAYGDTPWAATSPVVAVPGGGGGGGGGGCGAVGLDALLLLGLLRLARRPARR